MIVKTLYRYTRPDGGITVSTDKPDCSYTETYRLIADAGMLLTDGTVTTPCVDVDSVEGWTEILDHGDDFNEAAEVDYIRSLQRLGVNL